MKSNLLKQKAEELLDKFSKNHKICVAWDGGNDSGMVNLLIDNVDARKCDGFDKIVADYIEDYFNDQLGYGSWAGDFNAQGEAHYDPETKSFKGDDEVSYYEYESKEVEIGINDIPENYDEVWYRRDINSLWWASTRIDAIEDKTVFNKFLSYEDKGRTEILEYYYNAYEHMFPDEYSKIVGTWSDSRIIHFYEFLKYKY